MHLVVGMPAGRCGRTIMAKEWVTASFGIRELSMRLLFGGTYTQQENREGAHGISWVSHLAISFSRVAVPGRLWTKRGLLKVAFSLSQISRQVLILEINGTCCKSSSLPPKRRGRGIGGSAPIGPGPLREYITSTAKILLEEN